jgi:hypothetical protein
MCTAVTGCAAFREPTAQRATNVRADLRDIIDMTTASDVACMIAKPIQGVGGFAHRPMVSSAMKVLDERHLFISDEADRLGRTGDHFWSCRARHRADIPRSAGCERHALGGVVCRMWLLPATRSRRSVGIPWRSHMNANLRTSSARPATQQPHHRQLRAPGAGRRPP